MAVGNVAMGARGNSIDVPDKTSNDAWIFNNPVISSWIFQWVDDNTCIENEDLQRHNKCQIMM